MRILPLVSELEVSMDALVSGIVWFGNTVVICILACVVYCMVNKGGE